MCRERVQLLLHKLRLSYSNIQVHGTPRRLTALVSDLAARQPAQESKVRGPPAKTAFGPDGSPTKALLGFCKSRAVDVSSVTKEADAKGVEYCYVNIKDEGRAAAEVRVLTSKSQLGTQLEHISLCSAAWEGCLHVSQSQVVCM